MTSVAPEPQKPAATHGGWTYPGVIILSSAAMMVVMALDIMISGDIGAMSNIGLAIVGIAAAIKVRTPDFLAAVWVVPIAWTVALLTTGQLAPKRGGSFLREQILHLAYGLSMHAGWILGTTAVSAAIAIFRRGRRP